MEPAPSTLYSELAKAGIRDFRNENLALPRCVTAPYHFLVPDTNLRHSTDWLRYHLWKPPLPKGALLRLSNNTLCASPELCLLQMSSVLTIYEFITLGFELCSDYSLLPGRYIERPRLTTPAKLIAFLKRCNGRKGIKQARRISKYLIAGAASPREAALTALATLPYALGGYALPHPVLNGKIPLGAKAQRIAGKSHYKCDLIWPDKKVAIEYDSDSEHTGPERIAADALRRNVLQTEKGIRIITITNRQLRDPIRFESAMKETAKLLNIEMRKRSSGSYFAELDLREALFRHEHDFLERI